MYSSTWWWHNDANDGPSTIVWAYVFLEDITNSKNVQLAYILKEPKTKQCTSINPTLQNITCYWHNNICNILNNVTFLHNSTIYSPFEVISNLVICNNIAHFSLPTWITKCEQIPHLYVVHDFPWRPLLQNDPCGHL